MEKKSKSYSIRSRSTGISRQVARLEKELGFWTGMYQEIRKTRGTALQQVKQIQSYLEYYRERYREKFEKDLGKDFSVEKIHDGSNIYSPLREYFFPMEYQEKFAGIILPFFPKNGKAIFNPRLKDNKHATKVFQDGGYRIENVVCGYNSNEARYLIAGDEENVRIGFSFKDPI